MKFILAQLKDLDAIDQLVESVKRNLDKQHIQMWNERYPSIQDYLEDIEDQTLYLIVEEKIIGIFTLNQKCDEDYYTVKWQGNIERAAVLHRFCLEPSLQNQGIGKKVLNQIESFAQEKGFASIRLDVISTNPYAYRLYHHNGYNQVGITDWLGEQFILMEKIL